MQYSQTLAKLCFSLMKDLRGNHQGL
jgi:hypothetical protein